MLPRPPKPKLFPYTTLFRSAALAKHTISEFHELFQQYQFSRALEIGWALVAAVDKYIVENEPWADRKSTRLNCSHPSISYAVFCLKKKIDQVRATSMTGQ